MNESREKTPNKPIPINTPTEFDAEIYNNENDN